jgi:hypothetical protein
MEKFKAYRKIFTLKFDDPQLEGLEVRAASITMEKMLEVADQADRAEARAGLAEIKGLLTLFVQSLRSWNLQTEVTDDHFEDAPQTLAGLLNNDPDLVLAIALSWWRAMTAVSPSLGKESNSGGTSPEASIPMEALSPNPENWTMPN